MFFPKTSTCMKLSTMSRRPQTARSIALSVWLLSIAAGCSTELRHRTVLYDEGWSNDAAARNLICAPELRESCEQEARVEERKFFAKLSSAFSSTPECQTVALMKLTSDTVRSNPGYWRLAVDYHPRVAGQPFDLNRGMKRGYIEGDNAEREVDYICKAVKNNGVMAYW